MFDWRCCRRIDFREFLIAKHAAARDHEDYLPLCFQMFGNPTSAEVDLDSLIMILRFPYEMSRMEITRLAQTIQKEGAHIALDTVKPLVQKDKTDTLLS